MTWNIRRFSKRSNSTDPASEDPSPPSRVSTFPALSKRNTYDDTVQRLRLPTATSEPDPSADHLDVLQKSAAAVVDRRPSAGSGRSSSSSNSRRQSKDRDRFGRDIRKDRTKASSLVHKVMHGKEDRAHEKEFVSHWCDNQEILSPEEITAGAKEKGLGQSSKNLRAEDFEFLRTLGTGTFARVWLVKLKNPKVEDREKVFALKVLRKSEVVRLKQVDHVQQERAILADVAGHPFITTLITTFSDHDSLYMLLDYCPGGEIFSYLRKQKRFSESTARFYICEIVLILEFLHETEGVAYRDMKPENILLDKDGHVKLVDFGFAKRVKDRETYTLCGTPEYLAPEVIQSQGHTTAVDWWALGILLYEFITGYPPFWHQQPMEIYKQIVNKPITFPKTVDSTPVSENAKDLIRQLCTVDRSKRLGNIEGGARRVKEHPWFQGIVWEDVYFRKMKGPIIPKVRFAADAQCFDMYPDEDNSGRKWTRSDAMKFDEKFRDF